MRVVSDGTAGGLRYDVIHHIGLGALYMYRYDFLYFFFDLNLLRLGNFFRLGLRID